MAIFVNENTKVLVQGLTGGQGKYHGLRNRDYGTQIVGGITRGEEVATGIVEAMRRVDLKAPIVIRLDGTTAEEGRQILLDAGIPEDKLRSEPTMLDAARAAVAIANGS